MPTGQPGNTLPLALDNSTDAIRADYMLQSRMPVTELSTASQALTSSQAGLIVLGGANAAVIIDLPTPSPGLYFRFFFDGAPATGATIIRASTAQDIVIQGTTQNAVQPNTTGTELGQSVDFIGLSTSRWLFTQLASPVSSAYTSDFAAATASLWTAVASS